MSSFLMQDEWGQVEEAHSISAGLDYPGVGPEHAHLADVGRAQYHPVTDEEVLHAFGVLTRTEGMKESLLDKSARVIRDRLERYGSTLGEVVEVPHTNDGVADGIRRLAASGHDPVLVFGASAIVDRGDVVPAGLVAAGGQVVHLGMPVDPGNLLMMGNLDTRQVIGVPSCARSPKLNGFDWVLARVLAGIDVRPQDIMDMGAGGLLMEIETRPSPREAGR